jgi:hypothetical protein
MYKGANLENQFYSKDTLEEVEIKKVGIFSVANIFGMISLFQFLIFGLLISIFALIDLLILKTIKNNIFSYVGLLLFIVLPIFGYISGFISGAIFAIFYNISSKLTKGIKLFA